MAVKNREKTQFRTGAEQVETARKGGIASGKARREKKAFKETLETLLSMGMEDGEGMSIDDIASFRGLKGQNISVQEAILIAQVQKAMKGDTRAAEYIRDSVGQRPSDKVKLETNVDMTDRLKEIEGYVKGKWSDE